MTILRKVTCPFDEGISCKRESCRDCQVILNRIEYDSEEVCLNCLVDKENWLDSFGEEHKCYVS